MGQSTITGGDLVGHTATNSYKSCCLLVLECSPNYIILLFVPTEGEATNKLAMVHLQLTHCTREYNMVKSVMQWAVQLIGDKDRSHLHPGPGFLASPSYNPLHLDANH